MSFLFDYKYHIITSDPGKSISGQLEESLNHLKLYAAEISAASSIIRINWFYRQSEEIYCESLSGYIENSGFIDDCGVKPTIIAQAPTNGSLFQIVITSISGIGKNLVRYKSMADTPYISVESGEQKWVFLGVSGCFSEKKSIRDNSEISFEQLDAVLQEEGLEFINIARQWNYIPDIVGMQSNGKVVSQNYQEFNDVRGKWYRQRGLNKDFPAATGIGTLCKAVRLEIVAVNPGKDFHLYSIHNPLQKDAHEYSADRLVGTKKESTPLFERAKVFYGKGRGHIWVSGTAAIQGENSIKGDVVEQTRITINNIDQLISVDNLYGSGLPRVKMNIEPLYIRAYVKNASDGKLVGEILQERYGKSLVHVLEGDVCREELLVEVEGEFSISQLANSSID